MHCNSIWLFFEVADSYLRIVLVELLTQTWTRIGCAGALSACSEGEYLMSSWHIWLLLHVPLRALEHCLLESFESVQQNAPCLDVCHSIREKLKIAQVMR